MTNTIEANTLRDWLESHEPVVVLDVRSDEDRAQWAIPGSVHINAYEALKTGQPGALASAILPTDRPVITVCNAGRVSQTAAAILADRGFDAHAGRRHEGVEPRMEHGGHTASGPDGPLYRCAGLARVACRISSAPLTRRR